MVKKRRRYAREYKLEAVKLAREADRTVAEVARELGINPKTLHGWIKQVDARHPTSVFPGNGNRAPEEDELWKLRQELERVKQERDFLKKAAAYFVRESP
jgi:transposase